LIDANKNEVRLGRRLAAFPLQQILKWLLASPDRGEKRNRWHLPAKDNYPGADHADPGQDQDAIAEHPMHVGIVLIFVCPANCKI
jgi:hypothetical protein